MKLGHCELASGPLVVLADRTVVVLYSPLPDFSLGHMTLAVGIYAQDAIVLVADGRISRPELGTLAVETDEACKLHRVGPYGVATAGFTGLTDELLRCLRQRETEIASSAGIGTAKNIVEEVVRDYMRRFTGLPEMPPDGSLLLAGYESDRTTPRIFSLHCKGGFLGAEFHWVGYVRGGVAADTLAWLLLGQWKRRPTVEQAKVFGVLAVKAAGAVDPTVGPPYSVAVVTAARGYEDVSAELPRLGDESACMLGNLSAAWTL